MQPVTSVADTIRPVRVSVRCESLGLVIAAILFVGCGGKSTPSTPVPPPALTQNPPPVPEEAAPAKGADELPAARLPAKSPLGAIPSGDVEPPGREGAFALAAEPADDGTRFALDLPDAENNVDRFALTPPPRRVDSTRFVVEPGGEGGMIPSGDESEVPLPESSTATTLSAKLPKGFSPISGTALSVEGLPTLIRCELDGAVMGLIPEGIFMQGKDGASENVGPAHGVILDSYYIDLREVTFDKYEKYRAAVRDTKKRVVEPARVPRDRMEPVTGITWAEARGYAQWSGRELPSEAQWEKAARGPEGFDFPWGNGPVLWDRPRDPGQIDRVGVFKGDQSPFGIYDMAGNAREWCQDWYNEKYYRQLAVESGSTSHNPTGPRGSTGGERRVVKGGDPKWRVWARTGIGMSDRPVDVGFRCVLRVRGTADSK